MLSVTFRTVLSSSCSFFVVCRYWHICGTIRREQITYCEMWIKWSQTSLNRHCVVEPTSCIVPCCHHPLNSYAVEHSTCALRNNTPHHLQLNYILFFFGIDLRCNRESFVLLQIDGSLLFISDFSLPPLVFFLNFDPSESNLLM